jgi:hypothetical protein
MKPSVLCPAHLITITLKISPQTEKTNPQTDRPQLRISKKPSSPKAHHPTNNVNISSIEIAADSETG